jgi:hypothetical protein
VPNIEIEVRAEDKEGTWKETYNCDIDPWEFANNTIAYFNATLRSGERKREIVNVVVIDEKPSELKHDWEKQNGVTLMRGGFSYDIYKCKHCGVTGKRYGLAAGITRDSKFKAKKYLKCTAEE